MFMYDTDSTTEIFDSLMDATIEDRIAVVRDWISIPPRTPMESRRSMIRDALLQYFGRDAAEAYDRYVRDVRARALQEMGRHYIHAIHVNGTLTSWRPGARPVIPPCN